MKRLSLRTKIQISVIGLVLLICVGVETVLYCHARDAMFDEIRHSLSSNAATIASHIDAKQLSHIRTRSDEAGIDYKTIQCLLIRAKKSNPDITFIYTMRPKVGSRGWEFVVDAEVSEDKMSHVGDVYDVSECPQLVEGLVGPSADEHIVRDKWGSYVSGYAPIRGTDGRPVGIVGVDLSLKDLTAKMDVMRSAGVLFALVAALCSLLFGNIMSSVILSPLSRFINRIHAAARGDLDTLVDDRRQDEIGDVARTFNNMLKALQHKDRMLSEMNTDYLTGLNNHRHFQQRLKQVMDEKSENGGQFAVLMVDIDGFKLINDAFGHIAGDRILQQVASLLRDRSLPGHILARYGGEEFAILLPDASCEEAMSLADKLREEAVTYPFMLPGELFGDGRVDTPPPITVSLSIGVAHYPEHSREQRSLIMAADVALYRAKHQGRNCVVLYDSSEREQSDPCHVYTFIQDPSKSAIEALAAAVDARDHYTRNHSENVCRYACMIGDHMGLKHSDMSLLRTASLLHDVGKIGVPDHVLNKPGELTQEEREIIRTHPSMGAAIIRNSYNLDAILPGILYHHERYDGSGYPEGLAGEDIPLIARIISVADTFDALITNRPYRRAFTIDQAVEVLIRNKGTQFDPQIVDAFITCIDQASSDNLDIAA